MTTQFNLTPAWSELSGYEVDVRVFVPADLNGIVIQTVDEETGDEQHLVLSVEDLVKLVTHGNVY